MVLDIMTSHKNLHGKTYTAANGHNTYEVYYASTLLVPVIMELLQQNFGFVPTLKPVIGFDEAVAEVANNGVKLGIGWDNWSGAYVMGFCEEGSKWVNKISPFLDEEFEKPKYSKYIDL